MSKMGSHDPFGHLKHKLWPKKFQKSNWQFDSWPLKVGNRPDFLACRWCATYCWKALDEDYKFSLDLISIRGSHTKLCSPKVTGVPTLGIMRLWEFWDKMPFGCGPHGEGTKYTIRGKVMASPKSGLWWVLWVRVCPWLVLTPKVFQLCTNQLVVWFCASPHEWLCLSFFLVPSWSSSTPLYPQSVASQGTCPPTPCSFIVFTSNSHLTLSRSLGACHLLLRPIVVTLLWRISFPLAFPSTFFVEFFVIVANYVLLTRCYRGHLLKRCYTMCYIRRLS
jgi:hypothetical protein